MIINPYKDIWFRPKLIFENLGQDLAHSFFKLPIILIGCSFGLDASTRLDSISDYQIVRILISAPICIGMCLLIFGLIYPWTIRLFGRIWNGESTKIQMMNVVSISSIPFGFFLIPQSIHLVLGQSPTIDAINPGLRYLIQIWSFSLIIIGVARVQKFSYGMALLNILLSYLPILILALLRS